MKTHKYDVALSYAGEDRAYVSKVAKILRASGIKVFYDKFESADIWGKNLYRHLSEVFTKEARYCVLFISRHFAKKPWTRKEVDAAFARALTEGEYILPARFDNTEIPGLEETIAYLDLKNTTPEELSNLVLQKLAGTFTLQDVAEFYNLWHASVPTEGVGDRLREKLQRAGGSPSLEGIQFQARLSTALAEQYLKQRKVALGRDAMDHALQLVHSAGSESGSPPLRQVVLDCNWLNFIAMRFEGDALGCVKGCEAELETIQKAFRKGPKEPERSQLILQRYRIQRSLITYYYVAGFLPAAVELADTVYREGFHSDPFSRKVIDAGALAEAHLLPAAVMQRLLVYERFQLTRRILSAYLHVGDLRAALDFYAEFCRSYLAVIEGGAVDTLSLTTFYKLTGNLAGLFSIGDDSAHGQALAQLARNSFMISRLGALQQQLPLEYRQRGVLERVMAPTIDFESFNASSRTKTDQAASVRTAQKTLGRVKPMSGLKLIFYYPSGRPAVIDRVAVLVGGKNPILTAAHSAGTGKGNLDPGNLRALCEQMLLAAGELHARLQSAGGVDHAVKAALDAAGVKLDPGLALLFGVYDQKRKELLAVTCGNVEIFSGNALGLSARKAMAVHRFKVGGKTLEIALNSGNASKRALLREKAARGKYGCLTIGDR